MCWKRLYSIFHSRIFYNKLDHYWSLRQAKERFYFPVLFSSTKASLKTSFVHLRLWSSILGWIDRCIERYLGLQSHYWSMQTYSFHLSTCYSKGSGIDLWPGCHEWSLRFRCVARRSLFRPSSLNVVFDIEARDWLNIIRGP
jgi:hypothetical protein